MKTKLPMLNMWSFLVLSLGLAIGLGLLFQNTGDKSKAASPDLTIFVEEPYFHLFAHEIAAFDKSLRKHYWLKVKPLSESEAMAQFEKHPESMMILPREVSEGELSIDEERLPLKQQVIATGGSPEKTLYLIQDSQVKPLEIKFSDFIVNEVGKRILAEEGFGK